MVLLLQSFVTQGKTQNLRISVARWLNICISSLFTSPQELITDDDGISMSVSDVQWSFVRDVILGYALGIGILITVEY